jgi:hypothetical protein
LTPPIEYVSDSEEQISSGKRLNPVRFAGKLKYWFRFRAGGTPTTPGILYEYQKKDVPEIAIRKTLKIKRQGKNAFAWSRMSGRGYTPSHSEHAMEAVPHPPSRRKECGSD